MEDRSAPASAALVARAEGGPQAMGAGAAAQATTSPIVALARLNARLELAFLERRAQLRGDTARAARCAQLLADPDAWGPSLEFPRPRGAR